MHLLLNTDCFLVNIILLWSSPNLDLNSIDFGVATLQPIIMGAMIPLWAYMYLSSLNHSDLCLPYVLACCYVGLLVSYLPWISFLTNLYMFWTSKPFCISIILIYNEYFKSVFLFTFTVWTQFLAYVSTLIFNHFILVKKIYCLSFFHTFLFINNCFKQFVNNFKIY